MSGADSAKTNIDLFWEVIDAVPLEIKNSDEHNYQRYFDYLFGYLSHGFGEGDLIAFENVMDTLVGAIEDRFDIMQEIEESDEYEGISDDGWYYTRLWLVSRGKQVYEDALKDPSTLKQSINQVVNCEFEILSYIVVNVFRLHDPENGEKRYTSLIQM